jgi:MATE family multidrug resistance protein
VSGELAPDGRRTVDASARGVFALALPATLANIATPLLGLVDSTVIGRLGEAHLMAGVAAAGTIVSFVFWLMGFLRMGTAALTAQAIGAGDEEARRLALARALTLAVAIGVVVAAAARPLGDAGFALMGASAQASQAGRAFFDIRALAAPFAFVNYVTLGALFGAGRAGLGLAIQAGLNLVNAALTLLFVAVLDWGVAGAAWGTLIAEALTAAAGLALLRNLGWRFGARRDEILERAGVLRMLVVNRDIMIRTAALLLAFSVFTSMGARAGDVTLAANSILMTMFTIAAYALDGFATAAEQLAGQSVGARDEAGFRGSVKIAGGFIIAVGVVMWLAILLGGGALIDLMTTNEAARAAARDGLALAALTPLFGAPAFLFDGVFIGATWTRDMRWLMLAATAIFLAALFALKGFGTPGLWSALLIFFLARGLLQGWRYPALTRATFSR